MGAVGQLVVSPSKAKLVPITKTLRDFENPYRTGEAKTEDEFGGLFDSNGNPIIGYIGGDDHSLPIDYRVLDTPGAIMTHYHPDGDEGFGGTLSMTDLNVFARSQLSEMRAFSSTGQAYSVKAGPDVDRKRLRKWIKTYQKPLQKKFEQSYDAAFKNATTPLKSGPNKGKVKLYNPKTKSYIYRDPLTEQQAKKYARQYSVGIFDRTMEKNLKNFGVIYTSTKAGKGKGISK